MRLLIDAQLPPALYVWFEERGIEASHVRGVLGGQAPDREIADYAESHALVLVTKDDDFLLRFPPSRSKLIWLRCGNISNAACACGSNRVGRRLKRGCWRVIALSRCGDAQRPPRQSRVVGRRSQRRRPGAPVLCTALDLASAKS
ncbi:DUF5615 family PIN-like protein [Sphingomonas sp.]|jgi:predicted nuclease of predicted toxin-antitoxin system|uniref:DUF5615 family PIN-like protein n=1 Tax=Sphingomonas sp. TaxID=28214 RepID=UPI002ED84DBA